jgi:protein-L-isoaspartate(D-aspartate) O-methyltransferase
MYYGGRESWNLRDTHMFDTLRLLLGHHGPESRAVVWAHNSHLGDASATEMGSRGELNVGQLCREAFGPKSFHVGFGTHTGTVAAASDWDGPMEIKDVRPSHERSYERVCHDGGVEAFLLHLREPRRDAVRAELMEPRLERAIGVIYRPESELASHYFQAVLPLQFDSGSCSTERVGHRSRRRSLRRSPLRPGRSGSDLAVPAGSRAGSGY